MKFISRSSTFSVRVLLALFLLLTQAVLLQSAQEAGAAPVERPLLAQPPTVTLDVPDQALIGESVTFTVTFDNPDLVDPGYGPLIDLIIPTNGPDGAPYPDGLSFVEATYLGSSVTSTVVTVPGGGCVTHPYMMDGSTQAPVEICGLTPGDTFVTLRLPFGSFTPDQPPLTVNVTVAMSNLADLNTPLTIQARGGYQYGYNPLNDFCCGDDPAATLSGWTSDSVTPILYTLEKTYNGPEDETASGPNFPRQYTVTAQIAPGQTLTPFTLSDVLPNNMQFVSLLNTVPGSASCTPPSTTVPGGTLTCNFGAVSGTVSMTFEYYIPLRDAGGAAAIDPASGDDAFSCNNASAAGGWTPLDGRDTGGTVTEDPSGCEHTLTPKSIATQKGVAVVGGGQPAPGRLLEYSIDVQVSDFFAFDEIVLTDTFSDGQRWDTTFAPTLQILGNPATLDSTGAFATANYTVTPHYTPGGTPTIDGTTTVTFRISDEMLARSSDGRLVGGCVPSGGTGGGDPDCTTYNNDATTARVIFRTVIQEEFSDTYPSGDPSVDQGDVLDNTVAVEGRVLSTDDARTPSGGTESDDSSAAITIGRGTLSKAIYALNGSTSLPSPVRVAAGDTVTFRLTYGLVTSDFENLQLIDYLPLPIFNATEVTTHNNTVCGTPVAGTSCLGPLDTYHGLSSAVSPAIDSDAGSNWLRWTYGNYDSTYNAASTIDILFTVTVQDDPFADNMHLTNQAYVTEGSTNGEPGESASIIEITYTSPVMTTTKSVVATDHPAPTFTPALPVPFTPPGSSGPRWSGTINSSLLTATPIDSDVSGLDAGNLVTFAIFLVNEGSGINGAFDIVLRDYFDSAGFDYPISGDPNSINLQIYYGNGTGPIAYTRPDESAATPGDLFGLDGLKLVDPPSGDGVCQAHDPTSGNNVIVITYDLRVRNDVTPGVYPNTGVLVNYSGSEGGPNFLPEPQEDDATVTTDNPLLAKTLVSTEINNTHNGAAQAVIGELATYTVTLTIPEGFIPNAILQDTLDVGLAFVSLDAVSLSSELTITGSTTPVISSNGRIATFDFGNITNSNTDDTAAETITLTYTVVVLNTISNQAGVALNNSAALTWNGGSLPPVSADVVTIIEPVINTTKTVSPSTADAGDLVTFTVTLTNPSGSTTAYDVTWSDTLPSGLTYVPTSLTLDTCSASTPPTLVDSGAPSLTASGGLFQPGESCSLTFSATTDYSVTPGQVITNIAQTRWTSLPGDQADRSPHNDASDERTGEDGVGGALNDYASQGQAVITINNTVPQKYIVATSESHTGIGAGNRPLLAVGEIVRFRLVVQLPEGTSANLQIRDDLPTGLTYIEDSARLALLSNTAPIASTEPVGSSLGLALGSTGFGVHPWVLGNDPTGVTPSFPLPDANVGSSNSLVNDPDTYTTGIDPFFKLGTLTNNDSDTDAEYIIIEFDAVLNNIAAVQRGVYRNNTFTVFIDGNQNGLPSNTVQMRIVEPELALAKALTVTPVDAGDPIAYTLTITSATGDETYATAFDLNLTDTFDANLTNLAVSSVSSTQGASCIGGAAFSHNGGVFAGNNLTFSASCLDPGQTITLTITGTVASTAPAGYIIPNTANLTWSSLPGERGTINNPTESSTPGNSGADDGERNGSGTPAINDYHATSHVDAPLATPQIDKLTPSPVTYVIGEQVTYDILVTLPEGVTQNLQVVDDLPAGLAYVSHQIITTVTDSGGILAADYNGTLPSPTVTAPGGSGGDLTLSFGDTTTAADNLATNNSFLVRMVARVLNVTGNQNGTTLHNTATVSWTGGSDADSEDITLLEPELDIQKQADASIWEYGQLLTFTLNLSHLVGSTADAHNLLITDTLPAGLTYVTGSITASAGCTADASGAPTLTWACDTLTLGNNATLSYQARVNDITETPHLDGDGTAVNTANLTWTSQPGDNHPGQEEGERDGSGGVNDYSDSASHSGRLRPYYALGNRVWFDTDNNGEQDLGEVGVDGVSIYLYAADSSGAPTGPALDFTYTTDGGYYLFDYLLPGDYVAVIPYGNFLSGGALHGYKSSLSYMQADGAIGETAAPGPNNDTDLDDNGSYTGLSGFEGAVISGAVTLGGATPEPTGEGDLQPVIGHGAQPDNRSNLTVDFGFYRTQIGNLVFYDDNLNGAYDSGEPLLENVTVQLYSTDGTEIQVGPNGILGDGDDALGGVQTDATGNYLFDGLPQGIYMVRVTAPTGLISTVDTFAPADTADPDTNVDNNDNGVGGLGGVVSANPLTMEAGEVATNITVDNNTATTTDLTVDFGFTRGFALGNRVWFDTDNDSAINGTEVGADGVLVELYAADTSGNPTGLALATATTAGGGYYLFDNLYAGDYVVVLPASNFVAGGTLAGYWSSGTSRANDGTLTETPAALANTDVDSDDNGMLQTSGAVISSVVTLGPTADEPTDETDLGTAGQGLHPDNQANMTVDFGFYRTQIGNLVFEDVNRNGVYDAGDVPLENITVQLYSSDGTTLLATTTTDAAGQYLFDGLPQGSYMVRVTAPDGMNSTIDTYDVADNASPDTNTDDNDNGIGTAGGVVSSGLLTMTPGFVGNANNNTVTPADGTTSNPTVDFGFIAVYALGNRVWFDTDNDSAINGTEVGADGVLVELYAADTGGNPTGAALATATTDNGGYYLFNDLYAGDYVVILPASNFAAGGTLAGYWSSGTTRANDGTLNEAPAPDPDNDADSDDNGQLDLFVSHPGAVAAAAITLGGTEALNETDLDATLPGNQQGQPDAQANMTVDFGFYRTQIGNLVFIDQNANGNYESGTDLPQAGVTVELYSSNGATLLATTITDAAGQYLFDGLPQGSYMVRVTAPTGTISTIDTYNAADNANPDTNTDDNDNGIGTAGGVVSSGLLTMTPGFVGNANNNTVTPADGTTNNPTVDFGFVYPYGLGNRVWFDTNNNSAIDGAEEGVDNVVVNLYRNDGSGAYIYQATDTTANDGYYLFDNLLPGEYIVALPASNFATGGTLHGYWSSGTSLNPSGVIIENAAPSPENDVDSDDNGTLQAGGTFDGQVVSLPVTLGPSGNTEPLDEADLESGVGQGNQPDGRANMTVDFGFYRVSVGNLVYSDGNRNGNYDGTPTDAPLAGITVRLYASDGTTEITVGPDGILGTADDAVGGMITDSNGAYAFSGLPEGDYVISVGVPDGTASSPDDYNAADSANPLTNADHNDNGLGTAGGPTVSSAVFSLIAGEAGALNNNTVDNAHGSTDNPTLDFGFTPIFSLGNRVWFDTDNNSVINGAEVGADGVLVELYAADTSGNPTGAALATATTANGGYYLFNNLYEGDYVVVLPASNFATGGTLAGYWSSGTSRANDGALTETSAASANTNVDSDDNGMLQASGAVISSVVTLGPGLDEPTGESDLDATLPGNHQGQPDAQANMTVDFGFYTMRLGNLVWEDTDNNGLFDGIEVGINGVTVQLWSADGSTLLDTTVTTVAGEYTFSGLSAGNYMVRIPATQFNPGGVLRDYISSDGGAGNPYEPAPNPDSNITDSDDNGSITGGTLGLGGYVQTSVFALTPVGEQAFDNADGSTTEFRVDFGFYGYVATDLSVTKDDGVAYYLQGGTLTYTIVVSNNGPSDVLDATVFDAIPPQVLSWDWACTGATNGATGCDGVVGSNGDFTDLVNLPQLSSITYTVTATLRSDATGPLTNTVSITPPSGVTETNPGNNSASDIDLDALLTIVKDDGLTTVAPGSLITYTLTIENAGGLDLSDIEVTDTLPGEVTFQSATPAPTTITGALLTWTGLSLNAGDTTTITVTVRVNDTAVGPTIINEATVTDTSTGATDSDDDIDIVATSNLKTIVDTNIDPGNPTPPAPPALPNVLIGEIVTYQISLDVPAGATLINLRALDVLDQGLAFVRCVNVDGGTLTTTLPGGFAEACNDPINPVIQAEPIGSSTAVNQGRRADFTFNDIVNASPNSEALLVTYEVIVLDASENIDGLGGLRNNVLWTWDGGSLAASASPLEIVEPDMDILKDASPTTAAIGSTITFTLSIEHTSQSSIEAYDVLVSDILPDGLGYVDGSAVVSGLSPTSLTYNAGTHQLNVFWDVFPLGQSATITFQARFLGPSPVSNTANLIWTSLPIDPQPDGQPQPLSNYNPLAHERWYDPADAAGVDNYGAISSVAIHAPRVLPSTGFAPDRVTPLPEQPAALAYTELGGMWLEIPDLGLKLPLTGVPLDSDGWDLTWLSTQAGYLSGTTFPGQVGTTGLTAHVTLADGTPGPFRNLDQLFWGNTVILHADGYRYTYEVREMRTVLPNDFSIFKQDGYAWLTLVTCKGYVPWLDTYNYRYAVRAVLLTVEYEGPARALPRGLSR